MTRHLPSHYSNVLYQPMHLKFSFIAYSFLSLFCVIFIFEWSILNKYQKSFEWKVNTELGKVSSTMYLRNSYHDQTHFCRKDGSLHSIALKMASLSSDGIPKTRKVMSSANMFMIKLMPDAKQSNEGIFSDVEQNIIKMMTGYGKSLMKNSNVLNSHEQINRRVIGIESSFYSCLHEVKACQDSTYCDLVAKIIIQTEQISVLNNLNPSVQQRYLSCINECHNSDNCVVFEYSDFNYKWIKNKLQSSASMLLIPHMIQNRLSSWKPKIIKPLVARQDNAVFFGVVETTRRKRILPAITRHFARAQNIDKDATSIITGNIGESRNQTNELMAMTYSNSRICFNIHSYASLSPGEYHRLSEVIPFGCIPLFESFADTIGIDAYSTCGGVIFVDDVRLFHDSLISTLTNIHTDRMDLRLKWWENGIHWETLLHDILDKV